jgi:hypothetical protein
MKPPAGVIRTQPTMIAVAAPIAVTLRPRIRSRTNQVSSAQAGREQRVDEGEHALLAGADAAAAVEAEPAEPEQAGADQHVDGVVGEERLAPVVFARSDDERGGERREAEPISTGTPPAKSSVPCSASQPPPKAQWARTA